MNVYGIKFTGYAYVKGENELDGEDNFSRGDWVYIEHNVTEIEEVGDGNKVRCNDDH